MIDPLQLFSVFTGNVASFLVINSYYLPKHISRWKYQNAGEKKGSSDGKHGVEFSQICIPFLALLLTSCVQVAESLSFDFLTLNRNINRDFPGGPVVRTPWLGN